MTTVIDDIDKGDIVYCDKCGRPLIKCISGDAPFLTSSYVASHTLLLSYICACGAKSIIDLLTAIVPKSTSKPS